MRLRNLFLIPLLCMTVAIIGCGGGDSTELEPTDPPLVDRAICSLPLFTRTEPLPVGTTPEEFVTPEGYEIYCEGSSGLPDTHHKRLEDGEASVNYSNYSGTLIEQFHSLCDASPDFPVAHSRWVVTQDNYICDWSDTIPGAILCAEILEFPGPGEDYRHAKIGEVEARQLGEECQLPFDANSGLECSLVPETDQTL